MQLLALLEALLRRVRVHLAPGRDLDVQKILVSHSATCLLLKIFVERSHLDPLLRHFPSMFRLLILRLVPSDALVLVSSSRSVFSRLLALLLIVFSGLLALILKRTRDHLHHHLSTM